LHRRLLFHQDHLYREKLHHHHHHQHNLLKNQKLKKANLFLQLHLPIQMGQRCLPHLHRLHLQLVQFIQASPDLWEEI
jgi:hypothetical protein